jgi:protein involved in polysaccharide export with SLBB domain
MAKFLTRNINAAFIAISSSIDKRDVNLRYMLDKIKDYDMRLAMAVIVVFSLISSAVAWSQTADNRDPGIALHYNPMRVFHANLPKQALYFHRLPGISPDYRLGPGDVVQIDVTGNEALSQKFKISNSGKINFSLLGEIQAAGLTAEELESEIGTRLVERQLIKIPDVLVYIESYEAKPFSIVGEVDNPGEYIMSQQLTLMDAILIAGGLDFSASRYGFLYRRVQSGRKDTASDEQEPLGKKPVLNVWMDDKEMYANILKNPGIGAPGTELIKVDLKPLKEGGVLEPNILLKAGDVFAVPRRNVQFFYVVGDVVQPGAYEAHLGKSLPASQAISYAGGPTKTAKLSKGMLVRYDENGARRELKVDYSAILKGKQKDFDVLPSDIIFIPGSNAKTLGYGLLGVIPDSVRGFIIP